MTGDRTEEDYLAETAFVHFLAQNGASVADVIPSVNGKLVERVPVGDREAFVSCFEYAKGMLISDNDYRYREGHPLTEYFYNTGKTLGRIHKLSKQYGAGCHRQDYFEKYNLTYIDELLADELRSDEMLADEFHSNEVHSNEVLSDEVFSDKYATLKAAIAKRLEAFRKLPKNQEEYGLVHFDFSDGNYHIDMETGKITVFDFDNCLYCWYMFDLANLWTHGVGWYQAEKDKAKRSLGMQEYFNTVLEGYRSETAISADMLQQLPLFIDMVLIENIVDEWECCRRNGEKFDYADIEDAAECLIHDIPFAGFI